MDCVLVAGGRSEPGDPLFDFTQGQPKSLLSIAGRPVIDYVLQALMHAHSVDRITVVGLESGQVGDYGAGVDFVAEQGDLVANGLAGVAQITRSRPGTRHILFASADIPAATGPMIDDLVARCLPLDKGAYYFMVERGAMEAAFPGSSRTYVRLRDMDVAGADIFIADARLADGQSQLLRDLTAGRKRPWKLASIAGLAAILALLTRRLTLQDIERRATKILGTPVSVMLTRHPELAMDIDKPEQLLLLREILS